MMTPFARKCFIKSLSYKPTPVDVWVQGIIEQVIDKDSVIISDFTGKAKITRCFYADGVTDQSCLSPGSYCCVLGTLVNSVGMPEIEASKFMDLDCVPYMKAAWNTEVTEAQMVLNGRMNPCLD